MHSNEANPPRLFIALWPQPALREALARAAGAWHWPPQARRTPPERLHVTLHFLGTVEARRLPELARSLAVPWAGCDLVLDRPRLWPGGIAVLEAASVPASLAALHGALSARLQRLALPVEARPFRPHVTLARQAWGARAPEQVDPIAWSTGPGYALVQSLPGGAGYRTLQRFG